MVINMEAIYAPYHWFLSIKMLNRYTTSKTSTKYHEIQLQLPKSNFIMVPILELLILISYSMKWIIRKNVWKLNLETITMTIIFCHSYVLNVQVLGFIILNWVPNRESNKRTTTDVKTFCTYFWLYKG